LLSSEKNCAKSTCSSTERVLILLSSLSARQDDHNQEERTYDQQIHISDYADTEQYTIPYPTKPLSHFRCLPLASNQSQTVVSADIKLKPFDDDKKQRAKRSPTTSEAFCQHRGKIDINEIHERIFKCFKDYTRTKGNLDVLPYEVRMRIYELHIQRYTTRPNRTTTTPDRITTTPGYSIIIMINASIIRTCKGAYAEAHKLIQDAAIGHLLENEYLYIFTGVRTNYLDVRVWEVNDQCFGLGFLRIRTCVRDGNKLDLGWTDRAASPMILGALTTLGLELSQCRPRKNNLRGLCRQIVSELTQVHTLRLPLHTLNESDENSDWYA